MPQSLLSWWHEEKVRQAHVLVIGCGALGSEVIRQLCLLKVGHITVVDYDTIEEANLFASSMFTRDDACRNLPKIEAARKLVAKMHPEGTFTGINGNVLHDLGLSHFKTCNPTISCVDNRMARLFINRVVHQFGSYWIDGAIENLAGTVKVFGKKTACFECEMTEDDWSALHTELGCTTVVRRNLSHGRVPTTSLSASIIAAMQVQEAMKVIQGLHDKLRRNHFYYEGMSNHCISYQEPPKRNEDCTCNFSSLEVQISSVSTSHKVSEMDEILFKDHSIQSSALRLRSPLITAWRDQAGKVHQVDAIPKHEILNVLEQKVVEVAEVVSLVSISEYAQMTLHDLGIPPQDILNVIDSKGQVHYLQIQ